MCGILLNIGCEEIIPEHPALEIIRHRGPDDYGSENFCLEKVKVSLGHRRLSIIDLSERGHQPMSYANDRFWIVYNGEIYNYLELRGELRNMGFSFVSESDTEVLLAAYAKWGKKCLEKLNGIFAFAIFDRTEQKIFLARDRFGVKPLYYHNCHGNFRAVSEIKQLLSVPDYHPRVNREKLYHFLNTSDFSFDSETLWQNVYELPPGHCIEFTLGTWKPGDSLKIEEWYSPLFQQDLRISFEDAVTEFRRLLDQAIKLQLRADVPVGFLLSGGIDSSTLVELAHLILRNDEAHLKTYSSCYNEKSIDERAFINAVLEHTGADSYLHFPQPEDIVSNIDNVIWHNDIPVRFGSPLPHWLLYQCIKNENESRKVILEGQGADEILCGYLDFYWAFLYEQMHVKSMFTFLRQLSEFQKIHKISWKIILRKYRRLSFPDSVKYPPNPILNTDYLLENGEIPAIAIRREEKSITGLHQNRLTILRYILHNVDRNSMAHSRETRVPFLDHNLVEFCLRLPSSYKINNGLSKRILRDAVKDVLPEKINQRTDKQGYTSPVKKWTKNELNGFFRQNLNDAAGLPILKKEIMLKGFENFSKNNAPFDPVWWQIIVVNRWLNIFKIGI